MRPCAGFISYMIYICIGGKLALKTLIKAKDLSTKAREIYRAEKESISAQMLLIHLRLLYTLTMEYQLFLDYLSTIQGNWFCIRKSYFVKLAKENLLQKDEVLFL